MTVLDAPLAFAVVAGLLALVPGLDTALVPRSSLTRSRTYAWATALGGASGAMVRGIAGASYMLWLGGSMIWKSVRSRNAAGAHDATTDPVQAAVAKEQAVASTDSAWRGYLTGAGTNLLNPKVGVFYIATIPQFLPGGINPLFMGPALAGVHAVLTMAWFTVLIVAGGYAKRWSSSPRALAVIDRIAGAVTMVFGGTLLADGIGKVEASGPSRHHLAVA